MQGSVFSTKTKMGEAQWFISWEEFKTLPPSLKQFSLAQELENRRIGAEFIDKLGHAIGMYVHEKVIKFLTDNYLYL